MSAASRQAFDARVRDALADEVLQKVVAEGQDYMQALVEPVRAEAQWAAAVDEIARIRAHTLAHLDRYVDEFATNVEARGGKVFFAADAAEARRYVVDLAQQQRAKLIVKSKSMVTEEIELNPALESIGAKVVETDLGEFILQLAHEKPFHIVETGADLLIGLDMSCLMNIEGRLRRRGRAIEVRHLAEVLAAGWSA